METVKVVWSGITGRTGYAAAQQVANVDGVEIVLGLSRHKHQGTDVAIQHCTADADGLTVLDEACYAGMEWATYDTGLFGIYGLIQQLKRSGANVLADFSDASVFEKIVELAVRTNVPLISGTFVRTFH